MLAAIARCRWPPGTTLPADIILSQSRAFGDPGNAGELSGEGAGGSGRDRICGAVDYVYNIGTYEVTAGQYCEFLNAVADTDTYGLYNTNMWSNDYGCKIERTGDPDSYSYSVAGDWPERRRWPREGSFLLLGGFGNRTSGWQILVRVTAGGVGFVWQSSQGCQPGGGCDRTGEVVCCRHRVPGAVANALG
jgi:hypothetical protein